MPDTNPDDPDPESKKKEKVEKKDEAKPKEAFFLTRIWNLYNRNFLVSLALQYFSQNLTISMGFLVVYDLLKNRYGMEPSEV